MEAILPGLIKNLMGIRVVHSEELPDDLQHTKERKPDVLKKVTDDNEETFVLHIEFQIKDEKDMVFRMAEYYIMLLRCYQIPVRQYVVFLDEGAPRMADQIISEQMRFKYRIISLSTINYRLFLNADNTEEKMLSILGDFGELDRLQVVSTIVKEIFDTSNGDLLDGKYLNQLRILANLRNLGAEISVIMESVAKWFKKERDPFYQLGQREGMEKKTLEVIKALLLNTSHTVTEIAGFVNVSEDIVSKVKSTLHL